MTPQQCLDEIKEHKLTAVVCL